MGSNLRRQRVEAKDLGECDAWSPTVTIRRGCDSDDGPTVETVNAWEGGPGPPPSHELDEALLLASGSVRQSCDPRHHGGLMDRDG